jgi:hypothetical protein
LLRVLSFVVIAAALLALPGAGGACATASERGEIPGQLDDGDQVTLPPVHNPPPALAARSAGSLIEVRDVPHTAPFTSRIFRPPISALA